MASASEKQDFRKRKRKRTVKRLSLHEQVEVRSEEEGFLGSWHQGTISACNSGNGWFLRYYVKYDHVLADDGSDNLVEQVKVSLSAEDTYNVSEYQCHRRGHIRPKPPPVEFGKSDLYGICVDVYHQDCWWEGVIFDREDGLEQRKVFFPDLGDEMTITFDMVRPTQDWDDVTDTWHRRGMWVFLELIEEYGRENYVPVSVKQLWYDLREKDDFQKLGDWTSPRKSLWKELVLESICDNLQLVIDHLCRTVGSMDEAEQHLKFAKLVDDSHMNPQTELAETNLIEPFGRKVCNDVSSYEEAADCPWTENGCGDVQSLSGSPAHVFRISCLPKTNLSCSDTVVCALQKDFSTMPSNLDGSCVAGAATIVGRCLGSNSKNNYDEQSTSPKRVWHPAVPDMVSGAKFCPKAITEYVQTQKKKDRSKLVKNVRKHLLNLKWTIDFMKDKRRGRTMFRFRYNSPQGKCFYSLCEVCKYLISDNVENVPSITNDEKCGLPCSISDSLSSLVEEPFENKESNSVSLADSDTSDPDIVVIESEYCPQAAADWVDFGLEKRFCKKEANVKGMISRARKHLSALGWKFKYIWRNGSCELCYFSPDKRSFNSLRRACKASMDGLSGGTDTAQRHTKQETFSSACSERKLSLSKKYPTKSSLPMRGPAKLHKINVRGIKKFQKNRKNNLVSSVSHFLQAKDCLTSQSSSLSIMRYRRSCRGLIFQKNQELRGQRTRVLRSRKRLLEAKTSSPSFHNPRTLLSLLIDNNVVLPMAKVHYRSKNDMEPLKEGRITHNGIKCTCCQELFTLTGFEAHAGSKKHRPSANIFLEDGRSLLNCQQIIHDKKNNSMTGNPDRLKSGCHGAENDSVCSVCLYGGELILCDQCPSSFHKSCLGMKDIPSGDWFCPSCCCRICHQNKLVKDADICLDDTFISCSQCERRYHIWCLRNRKEDNLEDEPKGKWFCSKKCELIFLGLHELLGKPIPVGIDNLTWTLLKPMQSDSEASNVEVFTEIHCKLSIALDVMHECFEPVKESHTRRDLVKDVIFSKSSHLNRLNFRGFYTILLEKNDETITVASVRVYGEEVAEIPLVGTRFQYRRLGMCRILMNVLEKKLMDLGVQRLILPAVPSVLNTWTGTFGFSKMTDAERLKFVDYTFLDFQDTVMCHKHLVDIPSADLSPSKAILPVVNDTIGKCCDSVDFHGSVDALQEDQVQEGKIMEQEEEDQVQEGKIMEVERADSPGNDSTGTGFLVNPAIEMCQSECEPCINEISIGGLVEEDSSLTKRRGDGILICYQRRRC